MEHFMGRIEEEEQARAELEAKIQQHNTEIKEINNRLARTMGKCLLLDGQLADAKKKHGLTHESVRNLQTQVESLNTEVEQLWNERKEKAKEITADAKKLS